MCLVGPFTAHQNGTSSAQGYCTEYLRLLGDYGKDFRGGRDGFGEERWSGGSAEEVG